MGWVESAVVFYLRTMIGRLEPYQPNPLPVLGAIGEVELVRELATLTMLLMVGILAGRTWRGRLGCAALAFGVWDIAYYVFLRLICGWPHSLLDWDILFLVPLPWWGPVLAPVSIALLMIAWGALAGRDEARAARRRPARVQNALGFLGIALALYTFMADALRVAGQGVDALRNMLPSAFNWPLFCIAWLFMAAPILGIWRQNNGRQPGGRAAQEGLPGALVPEGEPAREND